MSYEQSLCGGFNRQNAMKRAITICDDSNRGQVSFFVWAYFHTIINNKYIIYYFPYCCQLILSKRGKFYFLFSRLSESVLPLFIADKTKRPLRRITASVFLFYHIFMEEKKLYLSIGIEFDECYFYCYLFTFAKIPCRICYG